MKNGFLIFAFALPVFASLVVAACSSSSGIDTTEYKPPDAGQPDASYCLLDNDCPTASQACGFPVADKCGARGVCVPVTAGASCSIATKVCGCEKDLVDTCGMPSGYVRGGPANGASPTGGDAASCPVGSQ